MESVLAGPLAVFSPVEIRLVSYSCEELVWDDLVRRHHYLGYRRLSGHRLKYLAFIRNQPVAALSFSGAALSVQVRDRFIGWDSGQRRAHLKSIANNSRFLILPWVRIPHLASHLLGRCVRLARRDWPRRSAHALWIVETFVNPDGAAILRHRTAPVLIRLRRFP